MLVCVCVSVYGSFGRYENAMKAFGMAFVRMNGSGYGKVIIVSCGFVRAVQSTHITVRGTAIREKYCFDIQAK